MNGYIKLFRQMTEWEWYKEPNTKAVFLHLLIMANHAPGRWQGIEIDRGQHLTSIKKLAEETGLSVKNVRTALNHLKATNEVAIKTANRWTLLTVENYDKYQGDDSEGGKVSGKQSGKQVANKWQTSGKQVATNKKDKKKKKEENEEKLRERAEREPEEKIFTLEDGSKARYVNGIYQFSEEETKDLLAKAHNDFVKAMKERKEMS